MMSGGGACSLQVAEQIIFYELELQMRGTSLSLSLRMFHFLRNGGHPSSGAKIRGSFDLSRFPLLLYPRTSYD